ncbi:aspartate/glutamate racemase family protein [Salisediminibacterium beveridgei]|uniref:Aspartate racemase n=1 Tax=Salisediminibacterium beveridgei TaxID=632773 RepID=A0A1D7QR42_9BACI|nr:aspartate/glutamate racemase family protein [Salisediminibacterium beveridgei]AOM81481.1 Aspartate racemase [Salisediminibacterium beveridgei]
MKTVGIIGGMSFESSTLYYETMNRLVRDHRGGLHSLPILLSSVDFEPYARLQENGNWAAIGDALHEEAKRLETAGAEVIVLATNTMHAAADRITEDLEVPFIHIGEATAQAVKAKGMKRIALLGTRFTMEYAFYREKFEEVGIEVMIPGDADRAYIHQAVFKELCLGTLNPDTKHSFLQIIDQLVDDGAQGIVLGCTEIPLLIGDDDANVPVFNTSDIHAKAAVAFALDENNH